MIDQFWAGSGYVRSNPAAALTMRRLPPKTVGSSRLLFPAPIVIWEPFASRSSVLEDGSPAGANRTSFVPTRRSVELGSVVVVGGVVVAVVLLVLGGTPLVELVVEEEVVVVVLSAPPQTAFMTRLPVSDDVPAHGLPGSPVELYTSFSETRVPVVCVPIPAAVVPPLQRPR